jgi:hypothetical protein
MAATAMIADLGATAGPANESPETGQVSGRATALAGAAANTPIGSVSTHEMSAGTCSSTVTTPLPFERRGPDNTAVPEAPVETPQVQRTPLSAAEIARLDADLRRTWQRWTAVVETISRGKNYARFSEPEYRQLHGELLALCRKQSEHAEGTQRERFQLLGGMVEPWLTPRTLAAADRETLRGLVQRCQQIEQELGVSHGYVTLFTHVAVVLCLTVAVAVGWQLFRLQREAAPARTWLAGLWKTVQANPVLWVALVVPAVVFLSIALLARRFRT